jgi:hypothetical protein
MPVAKKKEIKNPAAFPRPGFNGLLKRGLKSSRLPQSHNVDQWRHKDH